VSTLSYLILSYLILSYLILSYHILSYLILSYLILSYLILSYLILSYLISATVPYRVLCCTGDIHCSDLHASALLLSWHCNYPDLSSRYPIVLVLISTLYYITSVIDHIDQLHCVAVLCPSLCCFSLFFPLLFLIHEISHNLSLSSLVSLSPSFLFPPHFSFPLISLSPSFLFPPHFSFLSKNIFLTTVR
jgi:hypothetical protein